MNNRNQYQDSPCQLCARLAEENDLLKTQLDLAVSVVAQQIELLEEFKAEAEAATVHLEAFGFRN